jgi:hypothetical protein
MPMCHTLGLLTLEVPHHRALSLILFAGLISAAPPPNNAFFGDWKLDASRSVLTDAMTVESVGNNKYTFDFGGGAETITIDGTDQPSNLYGGDALSVAAEGNTWKVIRKKDGRPMLSAIWSLSNNGNVLTDRYTSFNADGSPFTVTYVYQRKAAASGFAGRWVGRSEDAANFVVLLKIGPSADSGVSIVDASSQLTGNMNFAGSMVRPLDERTLELMRKRNDGEISHLLRLELSADLKRLTMRPRVVPGSEPSVFVFDRQ